MSQRSGKKLKINKFTIGNNILCCSVIAKGRVCRFMAQTGN